MRTIGGRIKRLREDRELSIEEVAKAARIPAWTWREFEDGLRHPTGTQMVKLAHLFDPHSAPKLRKI